MKPKLYPRQLRCLVIYTILLALASIFMHETAHILTAIIKGVPFGELKLGFWGINPSVTIPNWVSEDIKIAIFYSGGLATGVILLLGYLLYWVHRYHTRPSILCWAMGLATIVFAGQQLIAGYIEGKYHSAYILGASSLLSSTNLMIYVWMISMVFFHFAICPKVKMRKQGE